MMIPDSRPTSNGGLALRYWPHPTLTRREFLLGDQVRRDDLAGVLECWHGRSIAHTGVPPAKAPIRLGERPQRCRDGLAPFTHCPAKQVRAGPVTLTEMPIRLDGFEAAVEVEEKIICRRAEIRPRLYRGGLFDIFLNETAVVEEVTDGVVIGILVPAPTELP